MVKEYDDWVRRFAEGSEKVEVTSQADGEGAHVVVCRLITSPLLMPDNLVCPCSKCFRLVQFRPHAPRKPPRMCDECVRADIVERQKAGDDVTFNITQATATDIALVLHKKGTPQ